MRVEDTEDGNVFFVKVIRYAEEDYSIDNKDFVIREDIRSEEVHRSEISPFLTPHFFPENERIFEPSKDQISYIER